MSPSFADEFACSRLINHYANLNDKGDWEGLANLYTEDGVYYRPTHPDVPVVGRAQILNSFLGRASRTTRHVVSNIVVDIHNDKTASAVSVILLFAGGVAADDTLPELAPGMPLVGTFEDELVKQEGVWKFAQRRGALSFAKTA